MSICVFVLACVCTGTDLESLQKFYKVDSHRKKLNDSRIAGLTGILKQKNVRKKCCFPVAYAISPNTGMPMYMSYTSEGVAKTLDSSKRKAKKTWIC